MPTQKRRPNKAIMVSHTHWDREWYLPFQGFRYKLVKVVDRLIEILETNPEYRYFVFDGQTDEWARDGWVAEKHECLRTARHQRLKVSGEVVVLRGLAGHGHRIAHASSGIGEFGFDRLSQADMKGEVVVENADRGITVILDLRSECSSKLSIGST